MSSTNCTLITICVTILLWSCQSKKEHSENLHVHTYQDHVGDITPDPAIDDSDFKVCHEHQILQYYNFGNSIQYKGEKYAIIKTFEEEYKSDFIWDQDGYITIRFVVNCEGKSGRFRVFEMDKDYNLKKMNPKITGKLLSITKSLDQWEIGTYNDNEFDYYQYLTFKLIDGQIKKILP